MDLSWIRSWISSSTSVFDLYTKHEKLGSGCFCSVFLVIHKLTNERFAMKEMEIEKVRPELLRTEINILKDCVHENIVQYHQHYFENDKVFIVMELCPHGDLRAAIKDQKQSGEPFSEEQLLLWFYQLFNAIVYLHDKKIIHRDIKPGNILLSVTKDIKLTDFNISKIQGTNYSLGEG